MLFPTLSIFLGLAWANGQFKSRPDLAPPVLNITIPATSDTAEGLLFFAPSGYYPPATNHGPAQEGPYIFTQDGDLVWSGFGYAPPGSENFRVQKFKGQDVLTIFQGSHNSPMGHGHGHSTIFNNRYQAIKRVHGAGHELADHHEFLIFNDTTAIFTVYDPEQRDLTPYGATSQSQNWILNNKVQKVDVNTNKLLWEWHSLDHVDPADTNLTLNEGHAGLGTNSSQAWHYFYMNAADVNPEQNTYLFSARSMCSIFKVDGATGKPIWRLGGKNSDFQLGEGVDFCWQHDTRFLKSFQGHKTQGTKEIISFFDNSAHENLTGGDDLTTRPYSEGKVVEIDTAQHTATLLASFRVPEDLSVRSQGNNQILENDNAFINWGYKGYISEHKPDGTPIFFAHLGSGALGKGIQNYRAFRFNWHATPIEDPALVAFQTESGTEIYVSWNGDTETKTWKFYDQHQTLLGETSRTGFETNLTVSSHPDFITAQAFDQNGSRLVTSPPTKPVAFAAPLNFQ
ncbi:hypothetical protein TRICI_003142 [Trichomonascus ciferrii]|uniref:ASST-domain-containing protein n=1 Tax=Trichomonascus ciferrii TaxID=44093 RepID=A0A642V4R0_9ASCO|nr:hypothetical protein TRICI_003142 [Trichomonascus ciferrii]